MEEKTMKQFMDENFLLQSETAPAVVVVAPDMRGDTPRRIVMAEAGICSYVVPSLFCRFSLSLR